MLIVAALTSAPFPPTRDKRDVFRYNVRGDQMKRSNWIVGAYLHSRFAARGAAIAKRKQEGGENEYPNADAAGAQDRHGAGARAIQQKPPI